MSGGDFTAIECCAASDLAGVLVGPYLLLQVEVVGVAEEANIEVEGICQRGAGDVDAASRIGVGGIVCYSGVLTLRNCSVVAKESGWLLVLFFVGEESSRDGLQEVALTHARNH